jgi:uncharacterized membrane protein
VLLGIGVGGFVDETVFHQLLHWHHFWDGGGQAAALVSDGVFHAASWVCTVGGLFWFADLRRRRTWWARGWLGGILLGAGGFQLFDGLVQHKLLGLHQVRYVPELWPYDLGWDLAGALALLLGAVVVRRGRRPAAPG